MLNHKNYYIKRGYKSRLNNDYFNDINSDDLFFQPEVYELAGYLAERSNALYIIDFGAGNGKKLIPLSKNFQIIAVDHKSNMKELSLNLTNHKCLEFNLENGLPHINSAILKKAIVISADVVEHIKNPNKYLRDLAKISKIAPYVLISTPDRTKVRGIDDFGPPDNPAHVREWSLDELNNLLLHNGFQNRMSGYTINTNFHQQKSTSLIISGTDIMPSTTKLSSKKIKPISVQAIITVYNEEDIIKQVTQHLINQGVSVHLIDNWSTDNSYRIIKKLAKQNSMITFEQFPKHRPSKYHEWGKLLKRVEDISHNDKYDWYIHYDADEIRCSPWPNIPLMQAISFVDSRGYNAIDFTVLDFRPTKDGFDGSQPINDYINYCEFGKRPGHFEQIKAWKYNDEKIDLSSSGGHNALFKDRKIYPIKFITKHYPLRSEKQAKDKIFNNRLPRISPEERKKGWHIQYKNFTKDERYIWDKDVLLQFSPYEFYNQYLVELISGIGLNR